MPPKATMGTSLLRSRKRRQQESKAKYATILQAQREEMDNVGTLPHDPKGAQLKSIWDTSNMDTFLSIAGEREAGFAAQRNVRVVVGGAVHVLNKHNKIVPHSDSRDWFKMSEELTIPKRPQWSYDMPAAQLEAEEKKMFIDWRRNLSKLEESTKITMTPFEKNLEVWRQLWRVVERSDIVLEIVDARNPLAFRCVDFEKYVESHQNAKGKKKKVILLLNKADLLTELQRKVWADELTKRNLTFFFFAAKPLVEPKPAPPAKEAEESGSESDEQELPLRLKEKGQLEETVPDEDEDVQRLVWHKKEGKRSQQQNRKVKGHPVQYANPYALLAARKSEQQLKNEARKTHNPAHKLVTAPPTDLELARTERLREPEVAKINPWDVVTPEVLLDHLALLRKEMDVMSLETPLMVGMVGYPNVGKSSTINSIMGCKKVVVSATPGKTKHFQTLVIPSERRVQLCDCPGLVFPSFSSTRETMVCDGILPIDSVRDFVTPIAVICQRIPRPVLEWFYSVSLAPECDVDGSTSLADRFLHLTARRRGYMTEHDKPNRSRIAKEVLKDYVDGKLIFVHPPPGTHLETPPELLQAIQHSIEKAKAAAAAQAEEIEVEEQEEDVWEDISSADEARALSDDGAQDEDEGQDNAEPLPVFFSRNRVNATSITQQELFNLEANMSRIAADDPNARKRKKKKANPQLDPDLDALYVKVNHHGEKELVIDSDDGIVEIVGPDGGDLPPKEKKKSKRQQRREMKKMGIGVPSNIATKVMGIESNWE